MAETTIEWTATRLPDGTVLPGYTFNSWWGCAEVSEACDHCYARVLAKRFGYEWGTGARHRFFNEHHWNEPRHWTRRAEKIGARLKVFCASMADVFERLPTTCVSATTRRPRRPP